ncbi:MAG: hypothetical protein HYX92_05270 [Chloroflexi bacterium]|nr:hypothetical protein [Chloroflexota bacterium]
MVDSNSALVILTFGLLLVTGYYAYETRRSRKVSEGTLQELQRQQAAQYDTHLIPTRWPDLLRLEVTNLGPGAAVDIQVTGVYQGEGRTRYFQGSHAGMSANQAGMVHLNEVEGLNHSVEPVEGSMIVETTASTVYGKKMSPEASKVARTF